MLCPLATRQECLAAPAATLIRVKLAARPTTYVVRSRLTIGMLFFICS